jgi:thiaminase/transcriptional activator TenA
MTGKRFTDELWNSVQSVYEAILRHPFVTGLADGTLSEDRFRFYVVQDALYLRDFARALDLVAAKSPSDAWTEFLSEHARETLVVERALHDSFFKDWGLTAESVYSTPAAPTNLAYTSYLLRVAAVGSFEEGVTALLPCDWIYVSVGKELEQKGSPNPLYQRWIDTYASEEFWTVVKHLIDLVDEAAHGLDPGRLAVLRRHFVTTSRYEWMFWDMAWRLESWPV